MYISKSDRNVFLSMEQHGSTMFVLDSFGYQKVNLTPTHNDLSYHRCPSSLFISTSCLRVLCIIIFNIKFAVIANCGKCSKAVEYRTVNNHLVNNRLMKCHQVCLNPAGRWIYRVIQYSNYLINFLITILWFAEKGFDVERMLNTHS